MVPYEELPLEQRLKDTLYVSVVKAVAVALIPAECPHCGLYRETYGSRNCSGCGKPKG